MVELGVLTAAMAAAAVVVGGFLASAIFAATSFVFAAAVYIIWPITKPFLQLIFSLVFGVLERAWDNLADIFGDGGIFSKMYELYTFGGVSASLEMLKPIMLVFFTMVLLVRFTLSRRPKNFRKWVSIASYNYFWQASYSCKVTLTSFYFMQDIWQGIEFSQSKPQARVDVSYTS